MNAAPHLHQSPPFGGRAGSGTVDALVSDALSRASERNRLAHLRTLEALDLISGRLQTMERRKQDSETADDFSVLASLVGKLDQLERASAERTATAPEDEPLHRLVGLAVDRLGERIERLLEAERIRTDRQLRETAEASTAAVAREAAAFRDFAEASTVAAASGTEALARRIEERLAPLTETVAVLVERAGTDHGTRDVLFELRRDIVDLRMLQEAGDRRTRDTLAMLHRAVEALLERGDRPAAANAATPEGATAAQAPASDVSNEARAMLAAARAAAARAVEEMSPEGRENARSRLLETLERGLPQSRRAEAAPIREDAPAETQADESAAEKAPRDTRRFMADLAARIRAAREKRDETSAPASAKASRLKGPFMLGVAAIAVAVGFVQATQRWADGARTASAPSATAVAPAAVATQSLFSPMPNGPTADVDAASAASRSADELFASALRLFGPDGVPTDPAGAERLLRAAAEKGSAKAAYRLGTIYEKGYGRAKDVAVARDWYLKAAQGGNVAGMHNLAVLLASGEAPDYAGATEWFRKAAEHGLRDSQYNAAVLSARGLGGPADLKAAYVWFALAAAAGDQAAAQRRDEAARRLDPAALAAAEGELRGFRTKKADPAANEAAVTAVAARQA